MVVHNPNNWHWVDKNCIDWAKRYFAEKLVRLSTGSPSDPLYVQVAKVNSVEGDCEVNQRKGKVISLFDLKIVLSIEGHIEDGTKFEGSIIIPEVAFDTDVSDYQFDISVYKETNKMADVRPLVREKLVPQLRTVFSGFGDELLRVHGGDIQVPQEQVKSTYTKANQASSLQGIAGGGAPKPAVAPQPAPAASKAAPAAAGEKLSVATVSNATSIHLEPTFNVSALELYRTYIDKQRIAAWTRSPPRFDPNDSQAVIGPGSVIHLFGGNVTMTLVEAVEAARLVFHWRLNSWSPAQISTLAMDFHESHEFHETKLVVSWSGIPIGDEDKVRDNFNEFYVRSVKITFGFGSVL